MRLSDYDKAVIKYFDAIFPNVVFGYQERHLWQAAEDNEQVQVQLPLIGVNRVTQTFLFDSFNNDPHVIQGSWEPALGAMVRHIPLDLTYQLDFYSSSREEVDDLWREVVRELLDHRVLDVEVEWDRKIFKCQFPILLKTSPVDNTDIMSFVDKNKLYRLTQDIVINQAKLFFADVPKTSPESGGTITKVPVRTVVITKGTPLNRHAPEQEFSVTPLETQKS